MSLFLVGFFKKVALADYLGLYVDQVYGTPNGEGFSETASNRRLEMQIRFSF